MKTLKLFKFALLAIVVSTVGCVTPVLSPAQLNRFSGLIDEDKLKAGSNTVQNASSKTLAIVYSVNVPRQLEANKELMSRFDGTNLYYASLLGTGEKDDGLIVLSSDRLLDGVIKPLKQKFANVILAKDIPDAFKMKADYVGILDMRLELITNSYRGISSSSTEMDLSHIANISILLINRNLEKNPEINSTINMRQKTIINSEVIGNRTTLLQIKNARTQMIKAFEVDLNSKISK